MRLGNGSSQWMCAIGRRQPANFFTTDAGLFASTSYSSRVRASGPGGLSGYSNAASATTQAPPPPTAPSNLTATAASSGEINLAWTASSGAVTTYLVERCRGPPAISPRSRPRPVPRIATPGSSPPHDLVRPRLLLASLPAPVIPPEAIARQRRQGMSPDQC